MAGGLLGGAAEAGAAERDAQASLHQAVRLHQAGRLGEAERLYLRWLESNPGEATGTYFLAGLRHQQGRAAAAVPLFRQVLERDPGHADAWLNLGASYKGLSDLTQAMTCFERAIQLRPSQAAAHFNLGVVLQELERPADALRCYERAIALRADYAQAHNNRGSVLAESNRFDEALECFERAVALMPGFGRAYSNRGATLAALNRLDEALHSCERALTLMPADAEAHNNCGWALARSGRVNEALSHFERALILAPGYAEARWNLSLAELRLARFAVAWPGYEYRWKRRKASPPHGTTPRWSGAEAVAGKRVLAWPEQGYGDTLQFCRYVPMLAELGAQVVLEVQPELKGLLGSLVGVAQLLGQGERFGPCDWQVPLLSLPLAFGTQLETIPAQVPYLAADPGKVERWRRHLGQAAGMPRIGIACSGSVAHENDRNRSMPLKRFAPLYGKAPLYLLQRELREADEAELREAPIQDLRGELADFSDTAALIECLDVVISVDTVVVHLAGALGKPVWVLLSSDSDWRWMLQRADSPWYPSARLFRQQRLGDWNGVIDQVVSALDSMLPG